MSKTANREAAKAYLKAVQQQERDAAARKEVLARIEVIGPFRDFVLRNRGPQQMIEAIDSWVESLTGHRTYLHARDSAHQRPPILLPHERPK